MATTIRVELKEKSWDQSARTVVVNHKVVVTSDVAGSDTLDLLFKSQTVGSEKVVLDTQKSVSYGVGETIVYNVDHTIDCKRTLTNGQYEQGYSLWSTAGLVTKKVSANGVLTNDIVKFYNGSADAGKARFALIGKENRSDVNYEYGGYFMLGSALKVYVQNPDTSVASWSLAVNSFGTLPSGGRTVYSKGTSKEITWTPALGDYLPYLTNALVSNMTIGMTTYGSSGSSNGSNSRTYVFRTPFDVYPTATLTLSDKNNYLASFVGFVQEKSKIQAKVSASGIYSSAISRVELKVTNSSGDTVYSVVETPNTTSYNKTFGIDSFDNLAAGTYTVTVNVKDSRGRSITTSKTAKKVAYTKPTLSSDAKAYRYNASTGKEDDESTTVRVYVHGQTHNVNNNALNKGTVVVRYRLKSASTYTTANTKANAAGSFSYNVDISGVSATNSYVVSILLTDYFGETAEKTFEINTAQPIMDIAADGGAIAFFGIAPQGAAKTVTFGGGIHGEKTLAIDGTATFGGAATFNGNATVKGRIYDRFSKEVQNGLAAYTGTGTSGINANTTNEALILTNVNTPNSILMFVETRFYSSKSSNRVQIAYPYKDDDSVWYRYYYSGAWSAWRKLVDERSDVKKIRMITGTIALTPSATSHSFHTLSSVLTLFKNKYVGEMDGVTSLDSNNLTIVYTNGDSSANAAHIDGTTIGTGSNSGKIYANFDRSVSTAIRINYSYMICNR